MLREITHDVFDIADRIKEIDANYKVFYNLDTSKFELHHKGEKQLTFPYESLDARAVAHVLKTRVSELESLMEEIDRANEELHRRSVKAARDNFEDGVSRALRNR